jgi:hypothetical protein
MDECFIVQDDNRQALSYVYLDGDPHQRAVNKPLTKDEARRIATNIAKAAGVAESTDQELARRVRIARCAFIAHTVHIARAGPHASGARVHPAVTRASGPCGSARGATGSVAGALC